MNYKEKYEKAQKWVESIFPELSCERRMEAEAFFPELAESEDERIRKRIYNYINVTLDDNESAEKEKWLAWLEKQGEKAQGKSIMKVWKDMRYEAFAQASGNRHESNYSDDNTKMFSLNDIDEIIEKMSEQNLANSAKTCKEDEKDWSEEDERLCRCLIKDQEKALDDVRNNKYGHSEIISDLKEMYRERISWLKSLKEKLVVK